MNQTGTDEGKKLQFVESVGGKKVLGTISSLQNPLPTMKNMNNNL